MSLNFSFLEPNFRRGDIHFSSGAPQRGSTCWQRVINFPRNIYRRFSKTAPEKSKIENRVVQYPQTTRYPRIIPRRNFASSSPISSVGNLSAQNPQPISKRSFYPFSSCPDELSCHILSYLDDKDLRIVDCVSKQFCLPIDTVCREKSERKLVVPARLPHGVNHKKFLLNLFPNAIGADIYEEFLGHVGPVPQIPSNYIEMAPRPGFKLILIPEEITITVDEKSSLVLDETTAVNGKKARLIEDPERALQGQKRKIKVPITPNNLILLTQKHLKKKLPYRFGGISQGSLEHILDQNGDIGVGPSRWSYQKEEVIGVFKPYRSQPNGERGQLEIASDAGLEIATLEDRIVYYLISYLKSRKPPQIDYLERTSTVFRDDDDGLWQSTISFRTSGPVFQLILLDELDDCGIVGAAARVLS